MNPWKFAVSFSLIVLSSTVFMQKFSYFINKFGSFRTPYSLIKANKPRSPSAIVCIHGFGGNADQFRYNMPAFANAGYDSYAFDLLGYGFSDKPDPRQYQVNELYNFETWADQTIQFLQTTVQAPVVLVCNSVGGLVGLQTAILRPDLIKGIVLINMSLRMLHVKKQFLLLRPLVSSIQTILRETPLGPYFFRQLLKPDVLRVILNQAYGYQTRAGDPGVDEETVQLILEPGRDPRAAAVFLDFTSYSTGPLPEELLAQTTHPVSILWGEKDPWEPVDLGRATFAHFPCVRNFTVLPGGGHCPMDQIPEVVNEEVLQFVESLAM